MLHYILCCSVVFGNIFYSGLDTCSFRDTLDLLVARRHLRFIENSMCFNRILQNHNGQICFLHNHSNNLITPEIG